MNDTAPPDGTPFSASSAVPRIGAHLVAVLAPPPIKARPVWQPATTSSSRVIRDPRTGTNGAPEDRMRVAEDR